MLLSTIDKDQFDKFNIAKGFLDQLKFYISPEIYGKETGMDEDTDSETSFTRRNLDFEKQSEIGRATGRMKVRPEIQAILTKQHEERTKKKKELVISGMGIPEESILGD